MISSSTAKDKREIAKLQSNAVKLRQSCAAVERDVVQAELTAQELRLALTERRRALQTLQSTENLPSLAAATASVHRYVDRCREILQKYQSARAGLLLNDGQGGPASPQRLERVQQLDALRAQLQASKDRTKQFQQAVDTLKRNIATANESAKHNEAILTAITASQSVPHKPLRERKQDEANGIQELRQELQTKQVAQEELLRRLIARLIAANVAAGNTEAMVERILALPDHAQRMSEAMALLKSTVIHFESDLKRIRTVQRLSLEEQVNVFKAGHNEVKVLVSMCLPKEESKRFSRIGHTGEMWPLTKPMLEERFPTHKLEIVNGALQDMVIAWDALGPEAKKELITAQDVVINAHLLLMIASYVTIRRWQKWTMKFQQLQTQHGKVSKRSN